MSDVVIAILTSSVISTIISGVFNIILYHKKRKDGQNDGIRILLYDRIKEKGTKYIKENRITYDEYEDLLKMHDVYHNSLHGNGFLNEIMNKVSAITPTTGLEALDASQTEEAV